MASTFWIHRGPFVTTLVDAQDCLRYAIESNASNGHSTSTVRTVAQQSSYTGGSPDFWYDDIAKITWHFQATTITIGGRVLKLNSFLRSEKGFTDSRVFTGPGEQPLVWKIKKDHVLELRHQESDALVARTLPPPHHGFGLLSKKPPRSKHTSLEVLPQYSEDSQLLNAIVITWTILDGLIQGKDINCSV